MHQHILQERVGRTQLQHVIEFRRIPFYFFSTFTQKTQEIPQSFSETPQKSHFTNVLRFLIL